MTKAENENSIEPKDIELVRLARAGDENAFQQIVRRYQRKVYSIAYGVVHNEQDALDIAQDVFIKIYNKLDRFQGKSAFYTWLYRITVNLSIDYHRRKYKAATVEFDEKILDDDKRADFKLSNIRNNPRKIAEDTELRNTILQAINSLPPDQKAVITLRELEGLSYDEIAETMKCSKGTVMSRLHYGRKKLQEALKEYM
jgi:RNA polymerase sigma-70 factor, ECF subfamily